MCLICIEWQANRMTNQEALRAVGEQTLNEKIGKEHSEFLTEALERLIAIEKSGKID